jgi:hypothetical protein
MILPSFRTVHKLGGVGSTWCPPDGEGKRGGGTEEDRESERERAREREREGAELL